MLYRENILKNIVGMEISKIRDQKRKPKLKDILDFFKRKENQMVDKKQILDKVIMLYGNKEYEYKEKEDKKFDQLMI